MGALLRRLKRLCEPAYWRGATRRRVIHRVCRGYSGHYHWSFFEDTLRRFSIRDICILGVYYGRDIAYLASLMAQLHRPDYRIVGVDKFEDRFCGDWPAESRSLTWEQAGFGPAPQRELAQANLDRLGLARNVELIQSTAEDYLATCQQQFDLIYIDTSHDYDCTLRTIRLAYPRLRADGVMAGDDFSDEGTWGVASAVREAFSDFIVWRGWIWRASPANYRLGKESADLIPPR